MKTDSITAIKEVLERPFRGRGLTDKIEHAMNLAGLGFTEKEIGDELGLSSQGVKWRLKAGNGILGTRKADLPKMVFEQIKSILDTE